MLDADSLSSWIGRSQEQRSEVSNILATRLAALLNQEVTFARGDVLPQHWYGILFGETALQDTLADDGHPAKGDFLPPVPFPRRMFAGKRVQFIAPLHIGEQLIKTSTIHSIVFKEGRSGPMCFVTVRHEIAGESGLAVIEEQDIVYRQAVAQPRSVAASPAAQEERIVKAQPEAEIVIVPDETMLFRYSAITFNAHRIHYDVAYAREREHYPGLVVNGGLTLLLMWQFAVDKGIEIVSSESRNRRPVFVGQPLKIELHPGEKERRVVALDAHGSAAIEVLLQEKTL